MTTAACWPTPIILGRHLCWFDGAANRTIPIIDVAALWTRPDRQDMNEWGYIATLPTENGATVDLTYDPGEPDSPNQMDERVSLWVSVAHPDDGRLIGAAVVDGHLVYDPSCLAEACSGCSHDTDRWWEYVTSPEQVMRLLAWLGSLPIKATR